MMNTSTSEELSVIIPCCNEEGNIPSLHEKLTSFLHELGITYRIWYIDDGSTDQTLHLIKELAAVDSNVRFVSFSRNFGQQKALKAGIDRAEGQAVVMMDADLQHPVMLIKDMLELWRAGYEVVHTTRKYNYKMNFIKSSTSSLFYKIINLLSDIKFTPHSPDFRLIDKKVVHTLRSCNEEALYVRGMMHWCGFNQTVLPFRGSDRYAGATKYTWRKMFNLAANGITSFSIRPLRLAIAFSTLFIVFSFIEILYVLYVVFFTDDYVSGWATLVILISMLGGVILLVLGIMGEYLGKIFMQGKERLAYIVKVESKVENE